MVIGIDRAGFVGEDGETHQGVFDVAMLTSVPGVTVFSPSGYDELKYDLRKAVGELDGLVCLRYPRGKDSVEREKQTEFTDYSFMKREGAETLLVSYGRTAENVIRAAEILESLYGVKCDVLKLNRIWPLDAEMVKEAAEYKKIFFFEEGMKTGGIAEHLLSAVCGEGFCGKFSITAVEGFIKQASVASQLKKYGLDTDSVIDKVKESLS